MNRQSIEKMGRVWRRQLVVRDAFFALAVASCAIALCSWRLDRFRWQLPVFVLGGTFAVRFALNKPWKLGVAQISRHLDRTYPELEESTALFLRPPGSLTLLERLQLARVSRAVYDPSLVEKARNSPLGEPPRNFLRPAGLCFLLGVLLATFTSLYFARQRALSTLTSHRSAAAAAPAETVFKAAPPAPKIIGNLFTVTPPVYTGHPPRQVEGFSVEAEEGSTVSFSVRVDHLANASQLAAGSMTVALHPTDQQTLAGSFTVGDTTLFALTGILTDGKTWNPPELFSVKAIKDQRPSVQILQPVQARTEIVPPWTDPIAVEAVVSDDYGVADAHLVATVAKGSGEAVKFREQTIAFDANPTVAEGSSMHFTKSLDLFALGIEAGDELYFFVEASDNRQPVANHTRSETRFILLRGPEEKKMSTGLGVAGVNLIPQYFRSERQIIIDTEKLIADRPTLPDAEFRSRANELGADQALLRLRYGRFLGEDQEESPLTDHLETNLNPLQSSVPSAAPGPHAAASIAQRFQQEHLAQDREGGGEDAATRRPADGTLLSAAQIRQPFVDSHDPHDKNTFFDAQTKGTMHDALAAMWEAEGFLRTVRPAEALAPEHRALDILKNIQQSERAYVQHVGFEAPPLKVSERRLKGETTGVPPSATAKSSFPLLDPAIPVARDALATLGQTDVLPTETLNIVEPILTAAATRQPENFLSGLQALRRLRSGGDDPAKDQAALERALLKLLPPANRLPTRPGEISSGLAASYFRALQGEDASR